MSKITSVTNSSILKIKDTTIQNQHLKRAMRSQKVKQLLLLGSVIDLPKAIKLKLDADTWHLPCRTYVQTFIFHWNDTHKMTILNKFLFLVYLPIFIMRKLRRKSHSHSMTNPKLDSKSLETLSISFSWNHYIFYISISRPEYLLSDRFDLPNIWLFKKEV